jgi:CHAT domain-containing protein/triacylglycerol esterase/lipase EstA (alpha/beta hydrolase family)
MTANPHSSKTVRISLRGTLHPDNPPPRALQSGTRGGAELQADPFISEAVVTVKVFDFGGASRDAAIQPITATVEAEQLLALETIDGFTLFIRADKLAEDLARIDPQAVQDGVLQLAALRDRSAATRGVADWLLARVSVLEIRPDDIIDAALQKARAWLREAAQDQGQTWPELSVTWLGTKALMWAIEQRLAQAPGLYRWADAQSAAAELEAVSDDGMMQDADRGPLLVFIHGTGSSTEGSFGALRKPTAAAEWSALQRRFGERIYAFEHRTLSESPIENALQLAKALPAGAKINLVAHSRGGLVGDLLCAEALSDGLIDGYTRPEGSEEAQADAGDQAQLRELRDMLKRKDLHIERYLRVASPARGTRLASGNFDAFLSCLLSLVGLVPALQANLLYSALKRVVLEIARNRTKPNLVPGIEAMLPESPMGELLANATLKQGTQLAVIAGDIQGGGVLKRLGVFFTDYAFFEFQDNDLVVDTDSMYGGLARADQAYYLFDQGPEVSHLRYFDNRRSRHALKEWLTVSDPAHAADFELMPALFHEPPHEQPPEIGVGRSARPDSLLKTLPQVYVIPDLMASHLAIGPERVWFDFAKLAAGGLQNIRWGMEGVRPEQLFEMPYGNLCKHLSVTFAVHQFPYDWRESVLIAADRLAQQLPAALLATDQPIRLLAHGMGGLVVRAMIAKHRDVWDQLMRRDGARLVLLGTPNHGSHVMVQMLLGKSDTVRNLARIDRTAKLQGVVEAMGEFPSILELLPSPHFADSGEAGRDYFQADLWEDLKAKNKDPWFGDQVGATPGAAALTAARKVWDEVLGNDSLPDLDKIEYVHGCAANTPCGIVEQGGRIKFLGTPKGDGVVTWDSGRLPGINKEWYMPAAHGELADKEEYFPAIVDLLLGGTTDHLPAHPPTGRTADQLITYDAGPVPYPAAEEIMRGLLGPRPARVRRRTAKGVPLKVTCRAMDLRFAQLPILCGHYEGDVISGAEAQIDRNVVDGALTSREHLGLYAGLVGTAAVVLLPQNEQERLRGSSRGAVIVGLGTFGDLSASKLTAAVRSGVLRYLLHIVDQQLISIAATDARPHEVGLASLLIGYNSTTNISIEDSVAAIVRGVCEANRQFEDAMRLPLRVGRLELLELFQDTAIAAARVLPRVAQRMAAELLRLDASIEAASELEQGEGARSRLDVTAGTSYWPRLLVTNADDSREQTANVPPTALAERLRFVFLSQRARAENVVEQRQPGLIEKLVDRAIGQSNFQPDLSRTLFQLIVPVGFKDAARQTDRLVLVLDGYTANLPWEMLMADDQPMALQTRVVRQLSSTAFRSQIRNTLDKTAYVVGNPDTEGFYENYGALGSAGQKLPSLDGADQEARTVAGVLESAGYQVAKAFSGSPALDVMNKLFMRPYRILHIAAHGIYALKARDNSERSGVILSDGVLLTAAEIGQMEFVPDLVFLNCCFIGTIDRAPVAFNRLAYSVARELIEMGVRAIVAAGWAVNDLAASTFAQAFYESLLAQGMPFGEAVFAARKETYARHPEYNTWGAYQAYGDPGFVMDPGGHRAHVDEAWKPVSPLELIGRLDTLRVDACAQRHGISSQQARDLSRQAGNLTKQVPKAWIDLPEVQYAVGRVYAELGEGYFELASTAYKRAIETGGEGSGTPVRAIEQLANLEARMGESTGDAQLVECAINRLQSLLGLSAGTYGNEPPISGNSERCALLGSAYKRKAVVLAGDARPEQWAKVKETLAMSRRWYEQSEDAAGDTRVDPYAALNKLAIDAVLESFAADTKQTTTAIALARRCAEIARTRFASSGNIFDAVMPAEALLIEKLIDGSLGQCEREVLDAYQQASEKVATSARNADSVSRQLRTIAAFLALRGDAEQDERQKKHATILQRIADAIEQPISARGLASIAGSGAGSVGPETASNNLANKKRSMKSRTRSKPASNSTPLLLEKAKLTTPKLGGRRRGRQSK